MRDYVQNPQSILVSGEFSLGIPTNPIKHLDGQIPYRPTQLAKRKRPNQHPKNDHIVAPFAQYGSKLLHVIAQRGDSSVRLYDKPILWDIYIMRLAGAQAVGEIQLGVKSNRFVRKSGCSPPQAARKYQSHHRWNSYVKGIRADGKWHIRGIVTFRPHALCDLPYRCLLWALYFLGGWGFPISNGRVSSYSLSIELCFYGCNAIHASLQERF